MEFLYGLFGLLLFTVFIPLGHFFDGLSDYFSQKALTEYKCRTGSDPVSFFDRVSSLFKKLFSRTK